VVSRKRENEDYDEDDDGKDISPPQEGPFSTTNTPKREEETLSYVSDCESTLCEEGHMQHFGRYDKHPRTLSPHHVFW
jgi:hypothetical protein